MRSFVSHALLLVESPPRGVLALLLVALAACASPHTPRPDDDLVAGGGSFEELWIVARDPSSEAAALPAGGEWRAMFANGEERALETERFDLFAELHGLLARLEVISRTRSPEEPATLEFALPLGEGAAIDSLTVQIGERKFRAIVRESEQAERLFQAARDARLPAVLLRQGTDGVVRQVLRDVEPGVDVQVYLKAVAPARWDGEAFELDLPIGTAKQVDAQVGFVPGLRIREVSTVDWHAESSRLDHEGWRFDHQAVVGERPGLRWTLDPGFDSDVVCFRDFDFNEAAYLLLARGPRLASIPTEFDEADSARVGDMTIVLGRGPFRKDPSFLVELEGLEPQRIEPKTTINLVKSAWAHAQMNALLRSLPRMRNSEAKLEAALRLALENNLVTPLTSYVLIDASR